MNTGISQTDDAICQTNDIISQSCDDISQFVCDTSQIVLTYPNNFDKNKIMYVGFVINNWEKSLHEH
jgi:hypothetical protein